MLGQHAILSPSAAHRWVNCTAAPLLEAEVEDQGSNEATEGTLAHSYCAMKLKGILGQDITEERQQIEELKPYHTGEMNEYTDTYMAYVLERFNEARARVKDSQLHVEIALDLSMYAPEAYGTADAIIITDDRMEVFDFKYGKGVRVDAYQNEQMMLYALGAWEVYNFDYDIHRIRMTIVQPRIANLSTHEMTVAELLAWAERVLKPAAREAYSGHGKQQPGDWCKFCKVKATCKALHDYSIGIYNQYADTATLSAEELAEVLPKIDHISAWCSAVKDKALNLALSGTVLPGYKLVEGRSVREITDTGAVESILLRAGYERKEFIEPSKLLSITKLEQLTGKSRFKALCGDYVTKPHGKPTLAPESDKRAPYNSVAADFDGFGE